jgi:hypothetical protein
MKIGHQKDFWGGVMFAAIGLLFAVIARGIPGVPFLPGIRWARPRAWARRSFPSGSESCSSCWGDHHRRRDPHAGRGGRQVSEVPLAADPAGPGRRVPVRRHPQGRGHAARGDLLIIIASLGSKDFHLRNSIILSVVLVIFCALIFVAGLKLPIPLCPDIESLQNAVKFCRS